MKKKIQRKINQVIKAFFIAALIVAPTLIMAQPPDPNGGSNPNGGSTVGGNAPIGGGLFILMGLAAGYGTKKVYRFRKNKND